ncbi:TM1266 family iron-only hydrogenase system putative regulator [Kiritimatiella glycovorans]|uniref:Putative iron-only hydrogenase system regulator n=1 Tax=Kiritimatiella glycovorans TaxID=1307763 RepID=A0A0G3EJX0_9BACT|nr:TM1266 family iron-only hydrogenase system putative regulator [Kiritimatiella glycovorans]AKJ65090.1 putative iron-only hydrogenase system regulator [Kiritimatiella glycovorans]
MERRLGFIGIVLEDREHAAPAVNALLTEYGGLIVSRTGVPYHRRHCAVIALVVDATTDELGKLTGQLGRIDGVSVKSMLSKHAPTADREGCGEGLPS